jgi:hypothetical protein
MNTCRLDLVALPKIGTRLCTLRKLLVTAASIIAGVGSAVIAFRLELKLDIEEKMKKGRSIEKSATGFPRQIGW